MASSVFRYSGVPDAIHDDKSNKKNNTLQIFQDNFVAHGEVTPSRDKKRKDSFCPPLDFP